MSQTRVLFVDDDSALRLTLPAILKEAGFEVTVASSVHEALAAISSYTFDVLVSDLNIGEQSDGFTVVSAMRRTQPDAVTFILTGYPAFESALQALRAQVDDYFLKPTNSSDIVAAIRNRLQSRKTRQLHALRRAPELLREQMDAVLEEWVKAMEQDPAFAEVKGNSAEIRTQGSQLLHGLLEAASANERGNGDTPKSMALVVAHVRGKKERGYTPALFLKEAKLLRRSVMNMIKRNLLDVELSFVITDLETFTETLDDYVGDCLETYLSVEGIIPSINVPQ
jgi:ActR/RegA family two-component response regulator